MYVSPNGPLPRNSYDPVTACEAARARKIVTDMETSVANAYNASQQIAGPESFRDMGAAVVIDVARSQNAKAAANIQSAPTVKPSWRDEWAAAPTVLPLNVTNEEFNGCSVRGTGSLLPIPSPPPALTMPPMMPDRVVVPQVAAPPTYSNLCWALRNGAVDQSQFDPQEFLKLSYRCTQLGYQGACFPPPNIALYLDQQRRAGTLPHISVSQAMIDAIPQAPDLTAIDCPTSWRQAGMAGYRRGLGVMWGDSAVTAPQARYDAHQVNWKVVGLLALAGAGLYAASRGNRGRR